MDRRSSCDIFCQIFHVPSKFLVTTLAKRRGKKLKGYVIIGSFTGTKYIDFPDADFFIFIAEK